MISISGTIRSRVEFEAMDQKWQQKKENLGTWNDMNSDELQVLGYQEQAADIRKSNMISELVAKLKSGAGLSADEMTYLRENCPDIVEEYEKEKKEEEQEERQYKHDLKNCRTKEEAETVRVNKLNGLVSEVKAVANNPNIPDGEKLAMLAKIMKRTQNLQEAYTEFTLTAEYREMPDTEKERAEEEDRRDTQNLDLSAKTEQTGMAEKQPETDMTAAGQPGTEDGLTAAGQPGTEDGLTATGQSGTEDGMTATGQPEHDAPVTKKQSAGTQPQENRNTVTASDLETEIYSQIDDMRKKLSASGVDVRI